MGKIIKWIFLIIIGLGVIGTVFTNDGEKKTATKSKKSKEELRYDNQTRDVKNCVRTLYNGVYKDKSLTWKLDSCNANYDTSANDPSLKKCIDIRNASERIIEEGDVNGVPFRNYSWVAKYKNVCDKTIKGYPNYSLFHMEGFLVQEVSKKKLILTPGKSQKIEGTIYVERIGLKKPGYIYTSEAKLKNINYIE